MELTLRVQAGGSQVDIPVFLLVGCSGGSAFRGLVLVDDNTSGDSVGNGDGNAQCGEIVELTMPLTNEGDSPTTNIVATLSTNDPALTLLHNAASPYPDLRPGQTATNTNDWDVRIGSVPDGDVAWYTITVVADGIERKERHALTIACGEPSPLTVRNTTVDDGIYGDSVGNNNKIAQCGELIELYVELSNGTDRDLGGLDATLDTDDPYVTLRYNERSPYPGLDPGATAENLDDWDIQIARSVPDRHVVTFNMSIEAPEAIVDVPVTVRCGR